MFVSARPPVSNLEIYGPVIADTAGQVILAPAAGSPGQPEHLA
jgi:hypothetical protein